MKKLKKLTAAMAVALGLGFAAPNASAIIEIESGGMGDALLFPLMISNAGWESYYAISNTSANWIQGHLRFRGAAWSAEKLDFDIILSPGDVFVFRVADVDGDGLGEVDMSLDPYNFMYTGMLEADNQWFDPDDGEQLRPYGNLTQQINLAVARCKNQVTDEFMTDSRFPQRENFYPCIDFNDAELVDRPIATQYPGGIDQFEIDYPGAIGHQKTIGYVEFFGEGVLEGMTHAVMRELLRTDNPGALALDYTSDGGQPTYATQRSGVGSTSTPLVPGSVLALANGGTGIPVNQVTIPATVSERYQNQRFSRRGTNLWRWTDADNDTATVANDSFFDDLGARDVPNVLTGTGFVSRVGGNAVSLNAEALIGFRTPVGHTHRIENYRVTTVGAPPVISIDNIDGAIGNDYVAAYGAVIIHQDQTNVSAAGVRPYGDYIYGDGDNDVYESSISFNNTWGPTLADGDDDDTAGSLFPSARGVVDDFDLNVGAPALSSSVAEVEEAIRRGGQAFHGHYFDGATQGSGVLTPEGSKSPTENTWFFAWFPTKFFYAENVLGATFDPYHSRNGARSAVPGLLNMAKQFRVELWDINENSGTITPPETSSCPSPFIPSAYSGDELARLYPDCIIGDQPNRNLTLQHELAVFSIRDIKALFADENGTSVVNTDQYAFGRVVLNAGDDFDAATTWIDNIPENDTFPTPFFTGRQSSFPGLIYSLEFENEGDGMYHWRPLQRCGSGLNTGVNACPR